MSENIGEEWCYEVSKRIDNWKKEKRTEMSIKDQEEFVEWVIQQRDTCYRNSESIHAQKDPCVKREWHCAAVAYQIVLNKLGINNFRSDQSIPDTGARSSNMEISIKKMPPLERQFEVKFYVTTTELKALSRHLDVASSSFEESLRRAISVALSKK
jgi:hypothetical protein